MTNTLYNVIDGIKSYIKKDYQENNIRFFVEVFAWACSVISSIIFALTVPTVPVIPLYIIFLSGCFAACWASWSRGSFGLVINYLFIIAIDLFGMARMLV
jgi:hypothetical protein